MNKTSIEWTHRPETRGAAGGMTWNPIRARLKENSLIHPATLRSGTFCTRISPGCTHCYASTINKRFGNGLEFTVPNLEQIEFFVDERILDEPAQTKKPCTIFAGDMNDIFHESIADRSIDQLIAVAAMCEQHVFQFLTKRADRMQRYFTDRDTPYRVQQQIDCTIVNREMKGVPEEYRAVPEYEGHYEISNYGNLRSKTGRPLSPVDDHKGYLKVALSKDGVVRQRLVHRLVLATFVRPSDEECRHRNGIGTDNRIANLRYCEHIENAADLSRHGRAGAWMKSEAPLTDAEVQEIRRRRANGDLLKDIEADTGVDRRKVSQIAHGKTYKTADLLWPLPNIWLGVSVESQKYADERIPLLRNTPAAVRFLSVEPQLEEVNLVDYLSPCRILNNPEPRISWVICGGESGPGARPFNLAWAESLLKQCRDAGVPYFFKQGGSNCSYQGKRLKLSSKGGDLAEIPKNIGIREFPGHKQIAESVIA